MFFDLVSTAIEHSERMMAQEMAQEINSLRADIANRDEQIAYNKALIVECDRECAEMPMELDTLREEYVFKSNFMYKSKRSKHLKPLLCF